MKGCKIGMMIQISNTLQIIYADLPTVQNCMDITFRNHTVREKMSPFFQINKCIQVSLNKFSGMSVLFLVINLCDIIISKLKSLTYDLES